MLNRSLGLLALGIGAVLTVSEAAHACPPGILHRGHHAPAPTYSSYRGPVVVYQSYGYATPSCGTPSYGYSPYSYPSYGYPSYGTPSYSTPSYPSTVTPSRPVTPTTPATIPPAAPKLNPLPSAPQFNPLPLPPPGK